MIRNSEPNDPKLRPVEELVLDYLSSNPWKSSTELYEESGIDSALPTLKRALRRLFQMGLVEVSGRGRATRYRTSTYCELTRQVDLEAYFEQEVDDRAIRNSFNFNLIPRDLTRTSLFTPEELARLAALNAEFTANIAKLSVNQRNAEMERLAIDLIWKSSQIEGNTYSLLETELLVKEQQTAAGKTPFEATMVLNHKDALDFILAHPDYLDTLSVSRIENIHRILTKDLNVSPNLRTHRVGISGTNYRPLDNDFQIREALDAMCDLVNAKQNPFEKALLVLLLLSYIQPFEDGNKRTARIVSNACLMAKNYCPLSFRTVDSIHYKKAMLLFYEQNNASAFKSIFMDQVAFAVQTYF